jgi:hypothetical protein
MEAMLGCPSMGPEVGPTDTAQGECKVRQHTVARDIDDVELCAGHGHQRKQAGLGTQICWNLKNTIGPSSCSTWPLESWG